jgi:hypothetical protein
MPFLAFLIQVVVSTAILIASMMIAGQFLRVDFGEWKVCVAKTAGLVIAVSLASFIPFLPFVVWFGGLYFLFGLGWIEALVLTIVNYLLSWVIAANLVALLFAAQAVTAAPAWSGLLPAA